MADLRSLYQEMILDHGRQPRNFGTFPEANYRKEGFNPLCGDKIIFYVKVEQGIVEKVQFTGAGCAISIASASLLTEIVKGKTLVEFERLFNQFHHLVTTGVSDDSLGKLAVLGGVFAFPARVKCATLAWHTLKAALCAEENEVSTE